MITEVKSPKNNYAFQRILSSTGIDEVNETFFDKPMTAKNKIQPEHFTKTTNVSDFVNERVQIRSCTSNEHQDTEARAINMKDTYEKNHLIIYQLLDNLEYYFTYKMFNKKKLQSRKVVVPLLLVEANRINIRLKPPFKKTVPLPAVRMQSIKKPLFLKTILN